MGAGILAEAALGFLGFGIQSPDVSLGSLVSQCRGRSSQAVAVHLAGHVHHHDRAVPAVHRRRPPRCLDPRQKRIPKRKDLDRELAQGRPTRRVASRHDRLPRGQRVTVSEHEGHCGEHGEARRRRQSCPNAM